MTTARIMKQIVRRASVLLVALCPVLAQAADQPKPDVAAVNKVTVPAAIASGAVEDSLKVCLARIPKDASAGQRMMGEQSCQRDEQTRQAFSAMPGR